MSRVGLPVPGRALVTPSPVNAVRNEGDVVRCMVAPCGVKYQACEEVGRGSRRLSVSRSPLRVFFMENRKSSRLYMVGGVSFLDLLNKVLFLHISAP